MNGVEQRKLGKTGLNVSRACLGTMTFGPQVDQETAERMVTCCFDHGINFFDTANVYNQGRSETILGEALKGRRSEVIVASKVGMKVGDGPEDKGLSRKAICRAVENSLRRLQMDCLDIYYLHLPDRSTPLEETLAAMDNLVRQGKVRYVGASNYASWEVCRMLWLAEKSGYQPVTVTQPMYSLLARGIEQEFLPMCGEFGLATVVYNPLAGGLLTGKHTSGKPLAGTRFDVNRSYLDRYWNEVNLKAVGQLATIAQSYGRSLVSLALNWLLHHASVDVLILGASSLKQLENNLRAIEEGPFPSDIISSVNAVWKKVRAVAPQYNR